MGLWSEVDRVKNKADEQATEKDVFFQVRNFFKIPKFEFPRQK